jgi:hypothetical protein
VVQIEIHRRDRRVSHPGPYGHHIDTASEPQTGRRVPEVVDPPAVGDRRPAERAFECRGVQLVARLGDAQ